MLYRKLTNSCLSCPVIILDYDDEEYQKWTFLMCTPDGGGAKCVGGGRFLWQWDVTKQAQYVMGTLLHHNMLLHHTNVVY